jgi:rhodanese-related sulfurtransferase
MLRCPPDERGDPGLRPRPALGPLLAPRPTSGHDDRRFSDKARQVILVCADGYSSSLAAATLRDLGFERATDVVGGFNGWVEAGLPIERLVDR